MPQWTYGRRRRAGVAFSRARSGHRCLQKGRRSHVDPGESEAHPRRTRQEDDRGASLRRGSPAFAGAHEVTDFARLLEALVGSRVEVIIIGGFAATAHGSAHVTVDLDLVYKRTPENIRRLADALA